MSRNSTPCKVDAVTTASPTPRRPGRRAARPSGDDRELAILEPADGCSTSARCRNLRRRPRQGRRNLASDLLLLLPVQGRGADDADRAGHRRGRRRARSGGPTTTPLDRYARWRDGHQRLLRTFGAHLGVARAGVEATATNAEVRELWSTFHAEVDRRHRARSSRPNVPVALRRHPARPGSRRPR